MKDTSNVNTPTDGNAPAPILSRGTTPVTGPQLTPVERSNRAWWGWHANRHSDRENRSVHAGATSHDDDGRAA